VATLVEALLTLVLARFFYRLAKKVAVRLFGRADVATPSAQTGD
jgi:hypothetical protein